MRFIAMVLFASLSFSSIAQTTLKLSTLYPPGSDAVKSLQQVAEKITVDTGGDVIIKIYPGGVMGDDTTVMRKIRIGQLHGALVSAATLDAITPDLKTLSQPFQFDSLDQVYQQRLQQDGDFRAVLKDLKWQSFGPIDGGFSYLMSKNPIGSMGELRESKLWLPNTSDIQRMAKALDVNYLVMNISDVLTGLDTGAIDTLVAPPSAALTLNWHSRFKFYTDTPVIYTWGMLVLPDRVFKKMSEPNKKLVNSALVDWSQQLDGRMRIGNKAARNAIDQLLLAQPFNADDVTQMRLSQR